MVAVMKEADRMNNTVFTFPGVGSHYSGMGKALYDKFRIVRETFEEASDVLKEDFTDLCFSQEKKDKLDKLENSQSALVCVSYATYRAFIQETGYNANYLMGYSLGEYAALCCSGMMSFADTLKLVRDRGLILREASLKIDGTMAWTVNLDFKTVENICNDMMLKGYDIFVSAYDCEDKTCISGSSIAIKEAAKMIEKAGGIVYPIKMSGPFHSPLMREAANDFKDILSQYNYKNAKFNVIANRNASIYDGTKENIVENLTNQLIEPIRWFDSINYLISMDTKVSIEMGPKNVLSYLMKRNTDKIIALNIDSGATRCNIERYCLNN